MLYVSSCMSELVFVSSGWDRFKPHTIVVLLIGITLRRRLTLHQVLYVQIVQMFGFSPTQ